MSCGGCLLVLAERFAGRDAGGLLPLFGGSLSTTARPRAPCRTPVGWSAFGDIAAAFPTVSVLGGVVTARDATTLSMVAGVWLGAG